MVFFLYQVVMTEPSAVVKKSISLSKVVSDWADELAATKGFGTNFSAYIADLIRRDREREQELNLLAQGRDSSSLKETAAAEIAQAIQQSTRPGRSRRKK